MPRTPLTALAVLLLAAACSTGSTQPARPTATDPMTALRRPLRLPALEAGGHCPVTNGHEVQPAFAAVLGDGPAYPTDSIGAWRGGRVENGWYYAKVLWVADPADPGPYLVRGRRLDGPEELRFGEGPQPAAELQLPAGGTAFTPASTWLNWPSYTRLRASGCYAYQLDAPDGSHVLVFQA
jgi:hypothetical protein